MRKNLVVLLVGAILLIRSAWAMEGEPIKIALPEQDIAEQLTEKQSPRSVDISNIIQTRSDGLATMLQIIMQRATSGSMTEPGAREALANKLKMIQDKFSTTLATNIQALKRLAIRDHNNANQCIQLLSAAFKFLSQYITCADIGNLRRTCKAFSQLWDNDHLLVFDMQQIIKIGHGTCLAQGLAMLGKKLSSLPNPIKITFDGHPLKELPAEIFMIRELRQFDLSATKASQGLVRQVCAMCPRLEELVLMRNNLKDLPQEIGTMLTLRVLNVADNQIPSQGLRAIWYLRNLEELNVSGNNLTELIHEMRELPQLKRLYLCAADLSIACLHRLINLAKGLELLDLRDNGLKQLPEAIRQLSRLKKLDCRKNQFEQETCKKICQWLPGTDVLF